MPRPISLAWALAAGVFPITASAIALGQLDDFEDGTTQGWQHSAPSPNPPTNVPNGGPQGAGDAYLRVTAQGSFSPGGRLVAYNTQQWTGDYIDAGVDIVRADLRNPGGPTLPMRVGIQSTTSRFVSTEPFLLPGDGEWHEAFFDLTQMTDLGGGDTAEEALLDVQFVRVLSADAPVWQGDPIEAEFGMDNVEARTAAVAVGSQAPGPAVLLSSRPNPFSGTPRIELGLSFESTVTVEVFDIAGRHMFSSDVGLLLAGVHAIPVDGATELTPGVWFFRVRMPHGTIGTLRVVKID